MCSDWIVEVHPLEPATYFSNLWVSRISSSLKLQCLAVRQSLKLSVGHNLMNCTALIYASDSNHVNIDFSIFTLYSDDMDLVVTIIPFAESVWPSYLAGIPSCLAIGPCPESVTYVYDL